MTGTHVLYRFYSATGQLLYVGITMSPPDRFKSHRDTKAWWAEVAGITVENYESRGDLEKAERRAIQVERPLHNVVHNGNRKPRVVQAVTQTGCTEKNPLGVTDYDASQLAALDGWQGLTQALERLFLEAHAEGIYDGSDSFAKFMGLLARSVAYMDGCKQCINDMTASGVGENSTAAPHKIDVHDGSMCARFRCHRGHEWFNWYTLRDYRWYSFGGALV